MNRLYTLAFKRILASLSAESFGPKNTASVLESQNVKQIGSFVFHKLPRDEMRNFIKNPCPVQNTQTQQNKIVINSSKSLRAAFSIQQQKVCQKCPHKNSCEHFAKPGTQNLKDAIPDLLIYMQAVNDRSIATDVNSHRFLTSGYKACDNILSMVQDLKKGGVEIQQFENIRAQQKLKFQNNPQKNNELQQKKQKPQKKEKNKEKNRKEVKFQQLDIEQNQKQNQSRPRRPLNDKRKFSEKFDRSQIQGIQKQRSPRSKQPRRQQYRTKQYDRNDRNKSYDRNRQYDRPKSYDRNRQFDGNNSRNNRYKGNSSFEEYGAKNNWDKNNKNREQRRPMRNREESSWNRNENKRFDNQERQYKSVNKRDRNQQDKKSYGKPDSLDNRFQKAGNVYRNPKVFQAWEGEQLEAPQTRIDRSKQRTTTQQKNSQIPRNIERQAVQVNLQQKTETQPRVGRKIRR